MFWVSEEGNLLTSVNVKEQLPTKWTPAYTTQFIKERYGGNPFTVMAFLGGDVSNGFIVLEISRKPLIHRLLRSMITMVASYFLV